MNNEIKALQERVKELAAQLIAANNVLQAAREDEAGIKVGDIVTTEQGVEYKVSRVRFYGFSVKPSLSGYKRKKDGMFGTVSHYIHTNWVKS